MFVDAPLLQLLDDCDEQVELFAATFPNGCSITKSNLLTAQRAGLDLDRFGKRVFGDEYYAAMAGPVAARSAAIRQAWSVYNETMAEPSTAYNRATYKAREAHSAALQSKTRSARSIARAQAAYVAVMKEAQAAYDAAWSKANAALDEVLTKTQEDYDATVIDTILSLV